MVNLPLKRGRRIVLVDDVDCDAGQRVRREPRGATIRDPNVEPEPLLLLIVERRYGANRSGALVDSEIFLCALLQDLVGEEGVDACVSVRRFDDQGIVIFLDLQKNKDFICTESLLFLSYE